jgi:hypothetical protein
MANHVRRQIREAVATAVTGLATTSTRVFQSRVYPLEAADLPCLMVWTLSETAEPTTIHAPRLLMRVVSLQIMAIAKATSDLDDTLDGICKEVEIALANAVSLASLCKSVTLTSTEIELAGTSEQPTGRATMVFDVDYYVAENAPDVAL